MQVEMDYYAILQLPPGASIERVRDHYRRLAKVFHPDRNGGDPWCQEQIKRINSAFEVLNDPDRKAAYDQRLMSRRPKPAVSISRPTAGARAKNAPMSGSQTELHSREAERPAWMTVASWLVMAISLILFGLAIGRHFSSKAEAESTFGEIRQMMLIPSLHTGLMSVLTGSGPKQIEQAYRTQLTVLSESAQPGLADAHDTLADLHKEDARFESSRTAGPAQLEARRERLEIEQTLRRQTDSLEARLLLASRDIGRFDWTTPGVRRRLRAGTIDEDLEQAEAGIEPLHNTVCIAQQQILDSESGSSSASASASRPQLDSANYLSAWQ
jgi:hypothetical protein